MSSRQLNSDSFLDADGVALSAHVPNFGPGWTVHNGTWQINTNHSKLVSATANACASVDSGPGRSNVTMSMTINIPAVAGVIVGGCGRVVDNNNCYTVGVEIDGAGTPYAFIRQYVAGVATGLASQNLAQVSPLNLDMTVVFEGPTITLTLTGETFVLSTVVATFNQRETRFGVYGYAAGGYDPGYVDNFGVLCNPPSLTNYQAVRVGDGMSTVERVK